MALAVVVAGVLAGGIASCAAPPAADGPPPAPEAATPGSEFAGPVSVSTTPGVVAGTVDPGVTTRTEITIGDPALGHRVSVWSGPDGVAARSETVAGLVAEERIVDGVYFVHVPAAAAVFGFDGWIRADLAVAGERRWAERFRLGLVELADAGQRQVGDEVLGGQITAVRVVDAHTVGLRVDGVGDVVVVVSPAAGAATMIAVPGSWVPVSRLGSVP